jgi:cytosine/adenosine deaminase-related metal-dependent hydrolase
VDDLAPAPLRRGAPALLVRAAAVIDAVSVSAAPGAILLRDGRIAAAGSPQSIGAVGSAGVLELPRHVLLPALANAHCHLDLTDSEGLPDGTDFVAWIAAVRARRSGDETTIAAAVARGAGLCLAGGTALVGDIAGNGSEAAATALVESGLRGVSYLECFGLGPRQPSAIATMKRFAARWRGAGGRVIRGLQPHAPYSCGPEVFAAAAALGMPVSTHMAETLEEIELVSTARGPLAAFIRSLGLWDESAGGGGAHPVETLAGALRAAPWTLVHLNYVEDRHIQMLAGWPVTVAYCPRASAYFRHPRPGGPAHRYRDMLAAGINVALGTDGLPCLDTPRRISPLDEMRFLYARDATDPRRLLGMATVAGARALGFDPALLTLAPGPTLGVIAVPFQGEEGSLASVLRSSHAPEWIAGGAWNA